MMKIFLPFIFLFLLDSGASTSQIAGSWWGCGKIWIGDAEIKLQKQYNLCPESDCVFSSWEFDTLGRKYVTIAIGSTTKPCDGVTLSAAASARQFSWEYDESLNLLRIYNDTLSCNFSVFTVTSDELVLRMK